MNRKDFIQNTVLAGSSVFAPTIFSAKNNQEYQPVEKTFHCNYAPHEGMFKNNAGSDFLDQIKFAYDNGFPCH
jgi:hydroxypyruvate isomerase